MDREIKFRAWDKKHKRMNMGGFWVGALTSAVAEVVGTAGPGALPVIKIQDSFILMQFTGLKDKKRTKEYPEGQEIYEGDLISNDTGRICEVKWHTWTGQWDAVPITKGKGSANWFMCQTWKTYIEITGNVHENPELIKKAK